MTTNSKTTITISVNIRLISSISQFSLIELSKKSIKILSDDKDVDKSSCENNNTGNHATHFKKRLCWRHKIRKDS